MESKLNDITIHYFHHGEGKPLIFLPGWGMSARATAYLMEPLFQHANGWQRVYIDPPGHGATPAPASITSQDDVLNVLLDFIDRQFPKQSFVLGGMSNGAYLAQGVLYHRAEWIDGLLMLVPVVKPDRSKRTLPPHTVIYQDQSLEPDEVEILGALCVRSRGMLDFALNFPRPTEGETGDPDFLDRLQADHPDNYALSIDVDSLPHPFTKPTLIITGRQDSNVGYRDAWALLENYPRATFVVLDRAGHYLEEKEDVNRALVEEWLLRVEEARE